VLAVGQVPLNLPAGWDCDKVFGETARVLERRADVTVPDSLLMKLDLRDVIPGAVRPQDAGLVLPQGGTPAPLMLIAGMMLLLLAGAVMLRRRSAEAGGR
jgi:Ca-activated chloride channel homolog